ncbi:MAG: amidohydrolase family protein [Clostridiales bacterium]|nr:amidohydrolase family protein [Clostridiales bacterium]
MIVDFHTHLFPDAMAKRALHQLLENTRAYASLYGETRAHTDATAAGLTASQKKAGIGLSLVLPIATSSRPSPTLNDFAAQVDRMPGLRSFGSVHPRNPAFREELHRIRELGLKGIKLHPEYQDCFADDPEIVAVVREAAALDLTVVFHAGQDIGMAPPARCTPARVRRLRQAVPDARLVLAHMGGYRIWEQVEEALPELKVMLDTSFCLPNHPEEWERFARLIRLAGVENVLFGTDSPWADQQESLEAAVRFLEEYGFSAVEQAAILGGNACRLLEEQP